MMTNNESLFDAASSYVVLEDGGAAARLHVDDSFWLALRNGTPADPAVARFTSANGWLLTTIDIEADSSRWEVHTLADELLILISGAIDLLVESPPGEVRVVELRPGKAFLVPKDTWHRFVTRVPSRFIGVAYGQSSKGTLYRRIDALQGA